MSSIIRHLFTLKTSEKLPLLPHMYATDFQRDKLDREIVTLMRLSHTRCPAGVEMLKRRHGVNAQTLITLLPPRKRRLRPGAKLMAIIQHVFGVLPYNPMLKVARREIRNGAICTDY